MRELLLTFTLLLVPQLAGAQIWPDAATPDNGIVEVTTTNGTELAATYADTRSYSFSLLSVPSGSTVVYSSGTPAVATINESTGDVTILKAGETTITATVDGTSTYTYKLTVKKAIATIAFSETNYFFVHQGTTKAIPVSTTPLKDEVTGEDIPLIYTLYPDNTHNTNGITINNSARTITVTSAAERYQHDGAIDFSDDANYKRADNTSAPRCSLKVVAPATALEIKYVDNNNQEVTSFEKTFGSTEVLPHLSALGYVGNITYTSSNEDVATVGASGDITLFRDGVTIITATTEETEDYSSATTSFTLTVHKASPTISFAKADQTTGNPIYPYDYVTSCETTYGTSFKAPEPKFSDDYHLSDTTRYTYSIAPAGIVEFSTGTNTTGNPDKIVYTDLNILKAGTVTITCSFPGNLQNNACSASYTLQVYKANATLEYKVGTTVVTESNGYVDVNGAGQWGLPNGAGGTEPVLSKPDGATAITYTSSNTDVATVNSTTGAVTPVGPGQTTITATLKDDNCYNNATASYLLSVQVPATISFANATASILNTETYTQVATVNPAGSTVLYQSSSNRVIVNSDGLVDPDDSFFGKVTITARISGIPNANPQYYYFIDNDTHFQATYELTVSKVFNSITFAVGSSYASYCSSEEDDLTLPEGIKAYAVQLPSSGNELILSEVGFIPGTMDSQNPTYTPILLKRDDTSKTTFGTVTKLDVRPSSFSSLINNLKFTEGGLSTDGKQYILYKDEFVKATGTISVPCCYLEITGPAPARGFVIEGGGDGSTDIDDTLINNEETGNGEWYDLQGRRIAKPTKAGLYIVNGKKVVVNNK